MSGPFRPGYPGQGSQANQPVSFKTDINRKKTKKWVAAKSYSYDGDDWGDDDEVDEDEDEDEAVPPLPETSRLPAVTTHQAAPNPTTTQSPTNVTSPSVESPGVVRPADIYKRMQEDSQRTPISQDSIQSNPISPETVPAATHPPVNQDVHNIPPPHTEENARSTSPLVIPEVKRLSGFDQDFFSSPAQAAHGLEPQVADQGSSLHHNPSMGFTSVVHQAFDVPEPSSSSGGDFSRSNSDSTSIISPIVGPWKSETDKTPTIAEDPAAEASAQQPPANFKPGHRRDLSIPSPGNGPDRVPAFSHTDESQSAEVVLQSPHDESVQQQQLESPTLRDIAPEEATPRPLSAADETLAQPEIERTSMESETKPLSEDTHPRVPTPLQIPEEHAQNIPQIVPSLSTETSPQDMESDRLRKEIMRSFSSDELPGAEPLPVVQNVGAEDSNAQVRQSTYLPSEYDSYWNDHQGIPPTSPLQLRPAAPPSEPSNPTASQDSTIIPPAEPVSASTTSESHPRLKKRFSWEESDDSDDEGDVVEEPSVPIAPIQPVQHTSVAEEAPFDRTDSVPLPASNEDTVHDTIDESILSNRQSIPKSSSEEKEVADEHPQAELSYVPPVAEPEPQFEHQEAPFPETQAASIPSQTDSSRAPANEASLPSFRKIMEIKNSNEKIRVFNETREQFAIADNGLSDWIRRSSESLPEHADLIQANGRLPGGAPTSGLPPKAKFPKLTSLGNLSLPTSSSHADGSSQGGFSPSHARRPSGSPLTGVMNRQNVESKGKDLLHSAGVLGGKAGGAARGLFAKGKSKLRGADKGVSSMFRGQRRRSWALSSEPDAQSSLESIGKEEQPVTQSLSSRYSLQPVPRIPSLRLGEGKSFRDSFEAEDAFSTKSRPFSLDLANSLRPVSEEKAIAPALDSPSSLRRAMLQFDTPDDDFGTTGESASAHDYSSPAMVTNSYDRGPTPPLNEHPTFKGAPKQSSAPLGDNEPSISRHISLDSKSNVRAKEGTFLTASSSDVSSELVLPLQHQTSHSQSQVSKLSEDEENADTTLTLLDTAESVSPLQAKHDLLAAAGESAEGPVSPPLPLPQETHPALPAEHEDRRVPVDSSEVSEISDEETEYVREKFDEEGVYSTPRKPSTTLSRVSDMTDEDDEDDDDEESDALREKLDEAGYNPEDPEKDSAWQQFPRPPTASSQPVRVVKMTRITMDRRPSTNDENDTKRYSRFSFEGEGNTLAEARLVNGYKHSIEQSDASQGQNGLPLREIPVTMGEDALDELPPPFPDVEAPYKDDHKQQTQAETPPYTAPGSVPSDVNNNSIVRSKGSKKPPRYQQAQSPPPRPSTDATWKTGRLQDLRTNRDSITSSSVSSISSPTVHSGFPRTAISPEPQMMGHHHNQRFSQDSQASRTNLHPSDARTKATTGQEGGGSFWSNGRMSGHRHTRTLSDNLSGSASNGGGASSTISVKRDEDSSGSRDSMVVQGAAAQSRNDLLLEPSRLNEAGETVSATSDPSSHARLSMQFRNKIKSMGKWSKDTAANILPVERQIEETKPVEKKKEKKEKTADGKKAALSRFGGIFNREQGAEQRAVQNTSPPVIHQYSNPPQNFQPAPVYTQPPTNHQVPSPPTSYSQYPQYPSMPGQNKPLPPPPDGYYAPTSQPVQKHPNYDYGQYSGPPVGFSYQAAPPAQQQSKNSAYSYYSRAPTSMSSHSYNVATSPINSTARASSTSSDMEDSRSRARDLRMRSRSPRPSPVRSVTRKNENVNYSDPIYNLGKFNVVTETARIGDQSLPFPITLPEDLSNGQLSPRTPAQPESSYFADRHNNNDQTARRTARRSGGQQQYPENAQKSQPTSNLAAIATARTAATPSSAPRVSPTPPSPPAQQFTQQPDSEMYNNREVLTKNTIPIELPVPGEDSDEEIVMSSTAYPGQEWQPAGFEQWMPY